MQVGLEFRRVLFRSPGRRRHTRFKCDWSSDVCSSDLTQAALLAKRNRTEFYKLVQRHRLEPAMRSEGRRVGKEWRSRWSPYHLKKNKHTLRDRHTHTHTHTHIHASLSCSVSVVQISPIRAPHLAL